MESGQLSGDTGGTGNAVISKTLTTSETVASFKVKLMQGYGTDSAARFDLYQDANNFITFNMFAKDSTYNPSGFYVGQKEAGAWTYNQTTLTKPVDYNRVYDVKLIVTSTRVKVYLDNEYQGEYMRPAFRSYPTIRLWNTSSHVHYDDVRLAKKELSSYRYDYKGRRITKNTPETTLFSDDFSTNLNSWQLPSANWTIASGELFANTTGDETMLSNQSFTDFTYQARIKAEPANDIGLFFRASDTSNGYLFRASGLDGNIARIYKKQAGGWAEIANGPITPPALNTWYTLKVDVRGSSIKGYLNGALIVSVTDATFTSGKLGIRSTYVNGTSHHIDDVTVTSGPMTTYYHYDGNNVVSETDELNKATASYAYLQGDYKPYSMTKFNEIPGYSNLTYYFHYNARGDVVDFVDQWGTVVAKYTYDPWGKVLTVKDGNNNDVSGNSNHRANTNPIRYAGYRYDTETGLYYLLARYYDPGSYRFLTKDPSGGELADAPSLNLYTYIDDNPINDTDPNGKGWPKEFFWHSPAHTFRTVLGAGSFVSALLIHEIAYKFSGTRVYISDYYDTLNMFKESRLVRSVGLRTTTGRNYGSYRRGPRDGIPAEMNNALEYNVPKTSIWVPRANGRPRSFYINLVNVITKDNFSRLAYPFSYSFRAPWP